PFDVRQIDGQDGLEVQFIGEETAEAIFATTIGDLHYLSVPFENEETGQREYQIARYEFVDNDKLRIYGLNHAAVLKAILDGELTGVLETERVGYSNTRTRRSAQMITDSRYYLFLYLKKHGKDCFLSADDFDITCVRQPN
ncbi:MAG TPA: hypothetical protein VG125_13515, partial [Pirellulales bacterium]|nr:hypothetical protein [Pirellulales bacterium]